MRTRGHAELLRAVPRVAPVQPLLLSAALAGVFVLTAANAQAAAFRVRVGSAVVAAALCFVLDDDAATTLASMPVSRLRRRLIRAASAAAFVGAWFALVILAADALTGVGRPPMAVFVEVGALALIACAVACVAIGRTDDGRGGIVGAFAAMVCFASAYLPPRWWVPLTAEPRVTRLAIISAGALLVALTASADPAVRRRRWTR